MTKPRGMPQADLQEAIRLYSEVGLSSGEIARRLHYSPQCIAGRLKRAGVEMRPAGGSSSRLKQSDLGPIVDLYADGFSAADIGRRLGIPPTTVSNRLAAAGVEKRTLAEVNRLTWFRTRDSFEHRRRCHQVVEVLRRLDDGDGVRAGLVREEIGGSRFALTKTLDRLRRFGVVAYEHQRWRLTGVELSDARRSYAMRRDDRPAAGDFRSRKRSNEVWLPIAPLRGFLEDLASAEASLSSVVAADTGIGLVAERIGFSERRLYAVMNTQETVSLTVADAILTRADAGVFLWDLWPEEFASVPIAA